MKEFELYQAYYDDYYDPFIWLFFGIVLILLLLVVSSITFSIFNGDIEGPETPTDIDIIFNYSNVNDNGPGILITNMEAMSDDVGKKLSGDRNYFDFSVSGNLKNQATKYNVLIKKDAKSNLNESDAKIYLTKINGAYENALNSTVPTYSNLPSLSVEGETYKVLYSYTYDEMTTEFSDNYRLRMWIKEDAQNYYEKSFSLKVSILAEGVE